MPITPSDICRLIKIQRILHGKKQREIAVRANLGFSVLSDIECGWRKPTTEQLARICTALGIRPEDLDGAGA